MLDPMMQHVQSLMHHAMSLTEVGLSAGCGVVIARQLKLSRWMWILLSGVILQTLAMAFWTYVKIGFQLATTNSWNFSVYGSTVVVIRSVGLLGWLLIAGGLWGVFSDIQRRLAS